MKNILFILLSIFANSQQISIVDSIDKRPIAYSKIIDKDNLYVTDSLGNYFFNKKITNIVEILANGYKPKKTLILSDTIILSPIVIKLDEIKLSKTIKKELGYKLSKSQLFLDNKREYAIQITNSFSDNCKIDELIIPFKKSLNKNGYLMFDVYEDNSGKIGQKLNYENYIISIKDLTKNKSIKISDHINLVKNSSIYISMIWIENLAKNSENFTNKIYLFTKPTLPKGRSYIRASYYSGWDIKPYEDDINTKDSNIPAIKINALCTP
ncbi:hypothetical protein [Empedobacter falsenii]